MLSFAVQSNATRSPAHEGANKTLLFRAFESRGQPFLVLVHTAAPPDLHEWRAYLQEVARLLATTDRQVHSFVVTDGGGPGAAQRKELADVIEGGRGDLLTHVFTTDQFVRGIVTAFRWIARSKAVAHAPSDFSAVCAECGVAAREVMAGLIQVQESFPPLRTLQLIRISQRL